MSMKETLIDGILLPIRDKDGQRLGIVKTGLDKKASGGNNLWGWQYHPKSPSEWIKLLDQGRIIVPGIFIKTETATKGHYRYSHKEKGWCGTQMIFCDGDNIKDVEFDDEGKDKNPTGIPYFTDPNILFERLPALKNEVYAIGHSVNSLSQDKPPPHVRTRIAFLLEEIITDNRRFKDFLRGLSLDYPIISGAERQPAQPVYGNAGNRHVVKGEKLIELDEPFTTQIFGNVLSAQRANQIIKKGETERKRIEEEAKAKREAGGSATDNNSEYTGEPVNLVNWLDEHNVSIIDTRKYEGNTMYLVSCPWENEHTEDFGARDTAVFVDQDNDKWCFNCFHDHCKHRGWEDYRAKVAPKHTIQSHRESRPQNERNRYIRPRDFVGNRPNRRFFS